MASTVRFLRKSLSLRSSKREKNSLAAQLEEERRRYEREQEEEAEMRRERRRSHRSHRSHRSRRAPREEEAPVDRRRSMRDAFDGADMSLQDKLRARARTSLRRSAAYGSADLCREPVGW